MKEGNENIVVRMAPSPTGNLHVGTARTTLYNYLFAKRYGGKFILRIEDTDTERSTKEFEQNILEGLTWLGLSWDEFYRQSERTDIYKEYVGKMIQNGSAYISKEEPKEVGQRDEVIRFKNPNKKVIFDDLVRGQVEFDTTELGDFVIARSVKEPLYHLAVVIDDFEMKVTHIIRGEDHISNTPRQILIQEAIGAPRPIYAHIPLILDADRKKLSKRKHGAAVWIDTYKTEGYLPEALLNFYAFIGWNPGTEQEIFTLDELCSVFDINQVQKGGGIFNREKLDWFNKEHIKLLPLNVLQTHITEALKNSQRVRDMGWNIDESIIANVTKSILERVSTFGEITKLTDDGELDYLFETPTFDTSILLWKDEKDFTTAARHIEKVIELLQVIPDTDFNDLSVKEAIWEYATLVGRGNVLWPTRVALSGKEKSPDPFTLAHMLGKNETLRRLESAKALLLV